MKKVFSIILFVLSAVTAIFDIYFAVVGMLDYKNTLDALASNPGASGADYLGIGWTLGIGLFLISVFGLLFSIISAKLAEKSAIKIASFIMIALFALLLIIGLTVFYA